MEEKRKHYLIYRITNLINGKIYIGKHETFDPNDGYMGSGKILKRAQSKYGLENFQKDILFDFETEKEMNAKEKELVNESFVARKDTYNLKQGGIGGFDYIHKYYKHHSEDAKRKIGEANSIHQRGSGNSQFGKHWYMNLQTGESSLLKEEDVPSGWIRGSNINADKKILRFCAYCGAVAGECQHPQICNKHQMIRSWKNIFHHNEDVFGSIKFYDILLNDILKINQLKRSGMPIIRIRTLLKLDSISGSTFYSCCNKICSCELFLLSSFNG